MRRSHAPSALAALAALAFALAAAPARAQLGPRGSAIQTSDYTLDLHQGPVLSSSRIIGLGGAYAPIAEGVVGYAYNPAAVAQRVPWSTEWFDWELDGGITLPSSVTSVDFDNNGDSGFTNTASVFLVGGGGIQLGDLGVGLTADLHQYKVASRDSGDLLNVNLSRVLLVGGYSLFDGELIVGLGISVHTVDLTRPPAEAGGEERVVASVAGPAAHLGLLWAPDWLPLRVGASVRGSPRAEDSVPEGAQPDDAGNYVSEGYYLPRTLTLPTEIHAGVALQLLRPMNLPWVNPRDEDSASRRADRAIVEAREKRRQEARRRLSEAEAEGLRGRELEALEDQLEAEEARARAAESERAEEASRADRARRIAPYRNLPREKLLISAAVKITAPVQNGVGVESFLTQTVERSGEALSFSPHLGVEAEVVPGYLVVRGGSYYEPTRFDNGRAHARIHGTGGLDVRIPVAWSVFGLLDDDTTFRVGGAVDAAARYFGWSVSAGIWR